MFHDTFIWSALFLYLPSGFENVERILLDVTAVLVNRQEACWPPHLKRMQQNWVKAIKMIKGMLQLPFKETLKQLGLQFGEQKAVEGLPSHRGAG